MLPLPGILHSGRSGETTKPVEAERGPSGAPSDEDRHTDQAQGTVVRMRLEGATHQAAPKIEGLERLPGISNYLIGNDPEQWHTQIPHYASVKYQGVYPGIDLVYYGNPRQLEYDFVLAPGADPGQIRIAFDGAQSLRVTDNGDLVLKLHGGELVQRAPKIYQTVDGQRRALEGQYVLLGGEGNNAVAFAAGSGAIQPRVGFQVARYNPKWPLTLDPTLVYSSYLGGAEYDSAFDIAVDDSGHAYFTGLTSSSDFPTANALYSEPTGIADVFFSKIADTGGGGVCPATNTVATQPATLDATDSTAKLALLRQFRDRVLSGVPASEWMVDAYYRHSAEVNARLLADRPLRRQALGLLRQLRPQLDSALKTGQLRLSAPARAGIRDFADKLMEGASLSLTNDLQWFLGSDALGAGKRPVHVDTGGPD